MKTKFLFVLLLLFISHRSLSQEDTKVLFTIDDEKISVGEFKSVYEKNLNLVESENEKGLEKNLDLFINYKLKVKEAFRLQLDTLKSYLREIETYKNQLYTPYLKDQKILDSLMRQAYERLKYEIKASHILVRLKESPNPQDTLIAYNKILQARVKIIKGEPFDTVAREFSEDRSVIRNGGDLGYFSAFKMVKEFEDAAYNTEVGQVTMPFRTQFGYHIMKVFDKRVSLGERQVAHILITGDKAKGKQKMDSVYKLIIQGDRFEDLAKKVSNDISSKSKGGVLPRFASGRWIPAFEKVAFSLKDSNEISKPFESSIGWHLIKLLEVYPVLSFEDSKSDIEKKIKESGRYNISRKVMIDKLRRKYKLKEYESSKSILKENNIRGLKTDSLNEILFSIHDKKFLQADFVKYIINRRHKPVQELYEMFIDETVLDYYKEDLKNTEPEFARTLKEYEEGLLLFELMQQKVWNKSSDSLAIANFYSLNKEKYDKPLDSIKGLVINDFQIDLEEKWIADLRNKSKISINNSRFKKLKKEYAKKNK